MEIFLSPFFNDFFYCRNYSFQKHLQVCISNGEAVISNTCGFKIYLHHVLLSVNLKS